MNKGILLAIDACGPTGSVALARLSNNQLELVGETELEGRSFSATLLVAVEALLQKAGARAADLTALVATSGPGSFTGVRIGLSTIKGLSEGLALPVATVTRLAVLAAKAEVDSAALDAHRSEVFLRLADPESEAREVLAGAEELAAIQPAPARIAVCDASAIALLLAVWPASELVQVAPPTALDALKLALPLILAGSFVNVELLDGHYLRRSDAEIFGGK